VLTFLRSELQEQPQKADEPVAYRLALFDTEYSDNASPDFGVELLLIKVFLHFILAFLPTLICGRRFIAAHFLDLAEIDYQLPLCSSRLLCISEHLRDLCAQRREWAVVWYFDSICRLAGGGSAC
jgi:hypothetical protein